MTVYFVLYAAFLLVFIVESSNARKTQEARNRVIVTVSFGLLFLMFALRHQSMGNDLKWENNDGYLAGFEQIAQRGWDDAFLSPYKNYERGYILFNKLLGTFTQSRQIFLAVCALITLLPVGYVFAKKSPYPLATIYIYMGLPVFLMTFSGVRQAIAIGITVYSVTAIQERKWKKFLALIFLATCFHKSAIVFMIAYPVYHMRFRLKERLLMLALLPVFYAFAIPLFSALSRIFKDEATIGETGAGVLLLVFGAVYLYCVFFEDRDDSEQAGYLNLFYLAIGCQLFSGLNNLAMRCGFYFMIYLALLLPKVFLKLNPARASNASNMDWQVSYYNDAFSGMTSVRPSLPLATRYGSVSASPVKRIGYVLHVVFIMLCFIWFGLDSLSSDSWQCSNPYYFFWENL